MIADEMRQRRARLQVEYRAAIVRREELRTELDALNDTIQQLRGRYSELGDWVKRMEKEGGSDEEH